RTLGHYRVAADRYQALLARGPGADGSGRWLLSLAEVEEARGRSREALGAYRRWLSSHEDDPAASTVRLATARLLIAVGQRDEAWASLEAIVAGDDPLLAAQAFLLQGRIAFEERDYGAALDAAAKAAEGLPAASPAHALARWRMARALEEIGRSTDAATHYRWLAEHAEEAEVRHASEERLARMMAKAKEAKTTP
ncbi:MAG: tetratricopeptide repeat protein, partial [Nitrospinota bacterium]